MINTEQNPNLRKHKILRSVVRGEDREAKRQTILPFSRTLRAQPTVGYKESRTTSPIPSPKVDKPSVAPGLEHSGFAKTTTKQY